MNKVLLRELTRKMRDSMLPEDAIAHSKIIEKQLLSDENYKSAKSLFIYVSFGNEVRTYGVIMNAKKTGKKVYIPKIVGGEMKAVECDLKCLMPNKFGVMEPSTYNIADAKNIDICITPGVVFDCDKNRIGYGRGYYDRFFDKYPDIYKIGLAYDIQVVKEIETQPHDIKMDKIITEKRII